MIFLIKHAWRRALVVAFVGALVTFLLGGWSSFAADAWGRSVLLGCAGGLAALGVNAVVHGVCKRLFGVSYERRFRRHGEAVLGPMRIPEYLTGGLMAAVVEEPLFRGLVLPLAGGHQVAGVALAALLFGAAHWLRAEFLPFWIWAVWEGVLFGALMVISGSVLAPMIAHGLHDVVAYVVLRRLMRSGAPTT